MSIHWTHDDIPDHTRVVDSLDRAFIYHQGKFTFGGKFITAADIEFPILTEEQS